MSKYQFPYNKGIIGLNRTDYDFGLLFSQT